jgi:hypothetical protein
MFTTGGWGDSTVPGGIFVCETFLLLLFGFCEFLHLESCFIELRPDRRRQSLLYLLFFLSTKQQQKKIASGSAKFHTGKMESFKYLKAGTNLSHGEKHY